MNIKTTILNSYFFISLMGGILIKTSYSNLIPISGTYLYSYFATIPLFVMQFITITGFSKKVKRGDPKLFKQACKRQNGSQGTSINVASIFDDSIPFNKMKEQSLIEQWTFCKRVVTYSMLSFLAFVILFFI